MIAVIADDLSGAAEIAGLALRYQLNVEMTTAACLQTTAEVLVVSMDTRSMNAEDAIVATKKTVAALMELNPSFLYKKIDSVLRGHILDETKIQLKETGLDTALIIPANPSLGRTIVDGQYYVDGKLIHQTAFSNDPEFAVTSSDPIQMLRDDESSVIVGKKEQVLPRAGIVIGEVADGGDLEAWASLTVNKKIMLAGAGDFFMALLDANHFGKKPSQISFVDYQRVYPFLIVSGTSFTKSVEAIRNTKSAGGPVCYMPAVIFSSDKINEEAIEAWSQEIVSVLEKNAAAIVAIDNTMKGTAEALYLRSVTAACVKKVLDKIQVKELYIEGGSTAAAIIDQLGICQFFPENELARGVIRMRVAYHQPLHITIKPGSYPNPAGLFSFTISETKHAL
ncbi:MAG: four-carbon acid sugar kinase family protein [Bacteroidota bacterium]